GAPLPVGADSRRRRRAERLRRARLRGRRDADRPRRPQQGQALRARFRAECGDLRLRRFQARRSRGHVQGRGRGTRRSPRGRGVQPERAGARPAGRSRPGRRGERARRFGLRRLPRGPGGGAADAAEGAGRGAVHRRVREREGLPGLRRLRHGQVRAARAGAEHGARAGAQGHPRGALRHRRRHPQFAAAGRGRLAGQHAGPGRDRAELPPRARTGPQRLDLGDRAAALGGEVL
ncbi:MAG: Short-chain dehydrogenase, associated with 2-hydroxychromene-2-carboxylate isomerase family protein, partial [uncultured Acetobacteraceae bacterium]